MWYEPSNILQDGEPFARPYGDLARQFVAAMKSLRIPFDHSLPGRAQTNSLAERVNQHIVTATSTCVLEAGIPPEVGCVVRMSSVERGRGNR